MDRIERITDALEEMKYSDVKDIWNDYCDTMKNADALDDIKLEELASYIARTGYDFGYVKIEIALEDDDDGYELEDFLEPYFWKSLEHLDKLRI